MSRSPWLGTLHSVNWCGVTAELLLMSTNRTNRTTKLVNADLHTIVMRSILHTYFVGTRRFVTLNMGLLRNYVRVLIFIRVLTLNMTLSIQLTARYADPCRAVRASV